MPNWPRFLSAIPATLIADYLPFSYRQQGAEYALEMQGCGGAAGLDPMKFDLKTFRSTYCTRMLRFGFDVRTVQHWIGHKSLETTMRYLASAVNVQDQVDLMALPGISISGARKKVLGVKPDQSAIGVRFEPEMGPPGKAVPSSFRIGRVLIQTSEAGKTETAPLPQFV